jgi:O-antigen/teichoic acid export membrane protein
MSPLVAAAGLAATVVVVHALAPRDFAIYAVVLSFKVAVQFASDFGTGAAATRLFGELQARGAARAARRTYVRLLAIRGLFAAVLIAGIALFPDELASVLRLDAEERDILPLLAAIGAIDAAASLGYSALAGLLRHRWINRAVLISAIVQPAAVIAAASAGLGLVGITAGLLVGSVARSGGFHLGAVLALRRLAGDAEPEGGVARAYVRTATGSIAGKVASFVHSRQPVTVIAIQSTARAEVAVFALAYDFVQQVLTALTSPFSSLLLPVQAAAVGDEERSRNTYQTAVRLIAIVVVPASAILLALFPAVSDLLFGPAYGDSTRFALLFVPMIAVEMVLAGPATALMLADDRMLAAFGRVKAVTSVLAVAYAALAGADLLVIAAAMAAIRAGSAATLTLLLHRRLGMTSGGPWVPRLAAASAGAGLGALAPALVIDGAAARLAAGAVLGALVLAGLLRALRVIPPPDAALARELLPPLRPVLELLVPGSPAR